MCLEDGDVEEAWPTLPYTTPCTLLPGLVSMVPVAGGSIADGVLCVEDFPVTYEGYTYPHGKIAYVAGRGPVPVVMIHPNYAGAKQFDTDQACFLARCGYAAVVVDHYKETDLVGVGGSYAYIDRDPRRDLHPLGGIPVGTNGEPLVNKEQPSIAVRHVRGAFNAMMGLLSTPKYWRGLMKANLEQAFTHPAVAPGLAAAIGYCFGGQACLEQVRNGDNLQAIVSFHGLLHSHPGVRDEKHPSGRGWGDRLSKAEFEAQIDTAPNNYNTHCKVLIENGDLDTSVPQEGDLGIDVWKAEMDAAGIDWRFNNHARTPHGFALAPGVFSTAYHELADRRSTLSMLSLFAEVWPQYPQFAVQTNACGTVLGQAIVSLAKL